MKYIFLTALFLTHCFAYSQIIDDFSDANFTSNPTWSGTNADYIVNAALELQVSNTVAATSYLSTAHGLADLNTKEWHFSVRQTFAPSSSNFGRVYLTASSADLTSDPDGFYLLFGEAGSLDAVRLFKVVGGVHTELVAGPAGQIASSFSLGVRVVRDNAGLWELFIDGAGGTSYVLVGSVTDATSLLGTHFGVYETYTASNATKFYYDNFYVGDEIFDTAPPILLSATAVSTTQIDVLFDEAVETTSAQLGSNYSYAPGGSSVTALVDGLNPALVHLTPSVALTNGTSYVLTTNAIADGSGNVSGSQTANFGFYVADVPAFGDVVINEFICDPSPVVGLPEVEFVEVYNRSTKIFDLQNWKLGDASSDGTIQQAWLLPGEHKVLCATAHIDSFPNSVAVTSFPSLNNSGDNIVLRSDLGAQIDSITYTIAWYNDPNKEDGGYSIERINPEDPCTDISDWRASNASLGGTPGVQNSVYDNTPDSDPPFVTQLIALAPSYLEVYFSEGMDSLSLVTASVATDPGLTVQNQYSFSAHPSMMTIQFQEALAASQVYEIVIQNVEDCWGNGLTHQGLFALPETITPGDLVVNEFLSDPITGGQDWVELYNNSEKLLDLYQLELANKANDTIAGNESINEHFLLYPGEYAVISEDTTHILQNYPAAIPGRFILSNVPSYSNDEGTIYVISGTQTIDAVTYTSDWHFKLLDSDDGKSLERIDPDGFSNDGNNWHTAAESIGFATPGGVNSQYAPILTNGEFEYASESISPDNDGFEDVLQISYEMNAAGYVGSFKIYDDRGRLTATVLDAELLGTSGNFAWQGVTDEGTKASIGTYIGVFEAFDIDGGAVFAKRKAFVVAGKF